MTPEVKSVIHPDEIIKCGYSNFQGLYELHSPKELDGRIAHGTRIIVVPGASVRAPISGKVVQKFTLGNIDALHRDIADKFRPDEEAHSVGIVIANDLIQVTVYHVSSALIIGDKLNEGQEIGTVLHAVKRFSPHIHTICHDGADVKTAIHTS